MGNLQATDKVALYRSTSAFWLSLIDLHNKYVCMYVFAYTLLIDFIERWWWACSYLFNVVGWLVTWLFWQFRHLLDWSGKTLNLLGYLVWGFYKNLVYNQQIRQMINSLTQERFETWFAGWKNLFKPPMFLAPVMQMQKMDGNYLIHHSIAAESVCSSFEWMWYVWSPPCGIPFIILREVR